MGIGCSVPCSLPSCCVAVVARALLLKKEGRRFIDYSAEKKYKLYDFS